MMLHACGGGGDELGAAIALTCTGVEVRPPVETVLGVTEILAPLTQLLVRVMVPPLPDC